MPPKKAGTKRKAAQPKKHAVDKDVDPDQAFEQAFYSNSSSSEDEDVVDDSDRQTPKKGSLKKRVHRKPKRPKTTIRDASDISDHEYIKEDSDDTKDTIVLGKEVPVAIHQGLHGPEIHLNVVDILKNGNISLNGLAFAAGFRLVKNSEALGRRAVQSPRRLSFVDLPPELSTMIYQRLFVTPDDPIMFTSRDNFTRSSQFLRTCRKIHEEGSVVLYGENAFHFSRAHKTRGEYYEKDWKEVGYKDVHRFLKDIGPHNLAKLRHVSIEFDDSLPTFTPYLDYEARKYTNDPVLIEILKLFAKHTKLEQLALGFHGKCNLAHRDYHFLKALCAIRCYKFTCDNSRGPTKIVSDALHKLEDLIVLPRRFNDNTVETNNKMMPRLWLGNVRIPYPWNLGI